MLADDDEFQTYLFVDTKLSGVIDSSNDASKKLTTSDGEEVKQEEQERVRQLLAARAAVQGNQQDANRDEVKERR
jgi:hypothetical protein